MNLPLLQVVATLTPSMGDATYSDVNGSGRMKTPAQARPGTCIVVKLITVQSTGQNVSAIRHRGLVTIYDSLVHTAV